DPSHGSLTWVSSLNGLFRTTYGAYLQRLTFYHPPSWYLTPMALRWHSSCTARRSREDQRGWQIRSTESAMATWARIVSRRSRCRPPGLLRVRRSQASWSILPLLVGARSSQPRVSGDGLEEEAVALLLTTHFPGRSLRRHPRLARRR